MDRNTGRPMRRAAPGSGAGVDYAPGRGVDPQHRLSPQRQFAEQNPEADVPGKQEPIRGATAATSATVLLASAAVIVAGKFGVDISADEAVVFVGALGALVNILTNEVARQRVFAPYK